MTRNRLRVTTTLMLLLIISTMLNVYLLTRTVSGDRAQKPLTAELYVCPMHPQVKQDHPGDCPICAMKLVKQDATGNVGMGIDSLATSVHLSPSQEILANVRTEKPRRESVRVSRQVAGRIVAKERAQWKAASRVMGRVDRIYVATPGELIQPGQTLYEFFSPDLSAAQREYLLARRGAKEMVGEIVRQAARDKLVSMGMSEEQINTLDATGEIAHILAIQASRSGVLMEKMVSEGEWVMPGMTLFEFIDLSEVFVEGTLVEGVDISPEIGDRLLVQSATNRTQVASASVSFVSPMVDMMSRTRVFRAILPNPDRKWPIGTFVTVNWEGRASSSMLTVSDDAILSTGRSQRVWIKVGEGRFQPREVATGPAVNGRRAILAGLQESDEVVTSGGYLIDSDAQLKGVTLSEQSAVVATANPSEPQSSKQTVAVKRGLTTPKEIPGKQAESDTTTKDAYICTMCPEVLSDQPGRCPKCGMHLVKRER